MISKEIIGWIDDKCGVVFNTTEYIVNNNVELRVFANDIEKIEVIYSKEYGMYLTVATIPALNNIKIIIEV